MEMRIFLINLIICFLLSFLIGIERQYRRRIVGLRTTILVCIGSFLFTSASFIVGGSRTDLTRIAASVVSGIGFLGAGVIIKDGLKVRGLTTAATMWCDASIGVLCGIGASIPAFLGTFVILFSNTVLRYINKKINNVSTKKRIEKQFLISIESSNKTILDIKKYFNEYLNTKDTDVLIDNYEINIADKIGTFKILLTIKKNLINLLDEIVEEINKKFKVNKIEYHFEKEIIKDDEEEIQ